MKKLLSLVAFSLLLLPVSVSAANFYSGENYLLGKDQNLEGDFYAAGNSLTLEGVLNGDFNGVGSTLLFTGRAAQDFQAAGGTLTLIGEVGDDLRAAGGSLTIGSKVSGDALLAGGQVTVLPSSSVNGDLIIGGGKISISGLVGGKVRVYGSEVVLEGDITGPVLVRAEKLTIGSGAILRGDVTYSAPKEATILPGADMRGELTYEPTAPLPSGENTKGYLAAFLGIWFVLKMLMLLAGSLLLCLYFRKVTERVATDTFANFGMSALLGFAFLIAVPVAGILLCVSVIGSLLGVLLLLAYAATLIGVSVFLPAVVGSELLRYWRKEAHITVSAWSIVLGVVVLSLLALVPVVGSIIGFLLFLAALGATLRFKWSELQNYR